MTTAEGLKWAGPWRLDRARRCWVRAYWRRIPDHTDALNNTFTNCVIADEFVGPTIGEAS